MSAISVANLCAAFIILRDDKCNQIVAEVEAEEKELLMMFPEVKVFHSCITNMVLGTLYCVKKNYNHGLSLILKSFENSKFKLGPDTW
jgi:tetratricopeptide repeat protein 30